MYSLIPELRGKGHGKAMLVNALSNKLELGRRVVAECLPNSYAMMASLRSMGFDCMQPDNKGKPTQFWTSWTRR